LQASRGRIHIAAASRPGLAVSCLDPSVSLEGIMEFSSLFDTLTTTWGDEILVWAVAAVAGCICLIAVVNVLDMFLDNNEMG
jgi:hypothetical protein